MLLQGMVMRLAQLFMNADVAVVADARWSTAGDFGDRR